MQFEKYLWIRLCEQLKFHNKGSDRCIDTLNRLWRKHPRVKNESGEILLDVPVLSEEMLSVTLEQWSLQQLATMNPPHERDQLKSFEPVIVLRWFEQDFLIDGNTRVNFLIKSKNEDPHAVLKIAEAKHDI